ncbi:MAG: aspartate carbamoyltransferase regulatory subunit [Solobacterium sp.]|jgi:aspartate carbamoyltransferase regulatory subunit|nr:aspartate carbamoyltransferase regulatory subunit [Solobacterium sp.]MBQ9824151.1 aspartate carbamoyltransferase regulatory subunit [Solobacterium sp.]MBR2810827.1 aspartate carbamoyltransferase regulatory subunit [Solobacterium sp.]MBR3363486.1 aspartate carbamoyltransferase regulatory subunit [Solobacterium sp.]
MNIDAIQNGIVIDHIEAGSGKKLYDLLKLDDLDCSVALLKNVTSAKYGRKDIIKIDREMDVNLDAIGFIAPNATVVMIKDGQIVEKKKLDLPAELVDVIRCKNPRCITQTEQEIRHVFKLTDRKKREYRCLYCEVKASI